MSYKAAMPTTILAAERDGILGNVRALVSAFDTKYQIGYDLWHTIRAGAFADSIAAQDALPLFWMHGWSATEQPPIGNTTDIAETDDGLVIAGELYIDDSETARSVYQAMRAGALREWSIGYDVTAVEADGDDDRHEIVIGGELLEASSVIRGANPATDTLKVANAGDTYVFDFTTAPADMAAAVEDSDPDGSDAKPEPARRELDLSKSWVRDFIRSQ